MTEAQSAIIDIQDALAEYGSTITFKKASQGTYNPNSGAVDTYEDVELKAIVRREATERVVNAFQDLSKIENSEASYDIALMFYHTEKPTKKDRISFNGDIYKIKYVSSTILQDAVIKYEVLISR